MGELGVDRIERHDTDVGRLDGRDGRAVGARDDADIADGGQGRALDGELDRQSRGGLLASADHQRCKLVGHRR